jgi:hypothetical protein
MRGLSQERVSERKEQSHQRSLHRETIEHELCGFDIKEMKVQYIECT